MDFLACRLSKMLALDKKTSVVFAAYVVVLATTVHFHEPWVDEAQSWLLARDLSLSQLLFRWVRYEGTPGLWHTVIFVAQRLHLPYSSFGWFAGCFAAAGVYILLRLSPFPFLIRAALPFTMFLLYQYAALARSYVLMPLLVFLGAHFYRKGPTAVYGLVTCLALLSCVSAQGTLICAGISLAYIVSLNKNWPRFDRNCRHQHLVCAVILGAVALLVLLMAWPPKDAGFVSLEPRPLSAVLEIAGSMLWVAYGPSAVTSAVFLIGLTVWCLYRRVAIVFLLPTVLLFLFFGIVYVARWHTGAWFLVAVAALWIGWPGDSRELFIPHFSGTPGLAFTFLLCCAIGFQLWWGIYMVRYDVRYPYSGSGEAATELKRLHAEHRKTYAFGFSTAAILPYFDRNIFANQQRADGASFWQWTKSYTRGLTPVIVESDRPEIVVLEVKDLWDFDRGEWDSANSRAIHTYIVSQGYRLVHESVGALCWKTIVFEKDSYLIYERVATTARRHNSVTVKGQR